MNFKNETLEIIRRSEHTIDDVMFIGSNDGKYRMTIEKFLEVSDFEYDDGYGAPEIPQDLIIYFKDNTYAERAEYDGSEWWEYNVKKLFSENDEYEDFDFLKIRKGQIGWETVESINKER